VAGSHFTISGYVFHEIVILLLTSYRKTVVQLIIFSYTLFFGWKVVLFIPCVHKIHKIGAQNLLP